jgi:tetratricopeptide (TPR) repeat protein
MSKTSQAPPKMKRIALPEMLRLASQRRWEEIERIFQGALPPGAELILSEAERRYVHAAVHALQRRFASAIELLADFPKSDSLYPQAAALLLRCANITRTTPVIDIAVSKHFRTNFKFNYRLGRELLRRGDYNSAITYFDRAARRRPESAIVKYALAVASYRGKRWRKFLDCFGWIEAQGKADAILYFQYVSALVRTRNFEKADREFSLHGFDVSIADVGLSPESLDIYLLQAELDFRLNRRDRAWRKLVELARFNPIDPNVLAWLGFIELRRGNEAACIDYWLKVFNRGDLGQCERLFAKEIATIYSRLAKGLIERREWSKALEVKTRLY